MNAKGLSTHIHFRKAKGARCLLVAALGVALLALALPPAARADPGTLYVDADATGGAGTGLSWSDAFTEVQSALAVAVAGDEIWVAEGVYLPDYDPGSGTHTGIVSATFVLADGVALYGGFAGGESERDARDPQAHVTVLSGDLDGDDGTDARGVVTDTARIAGDNARTVVMSSGVTETAVLDGFTVTAGNADGSGGDWQAPHRSGGGMYNTGGSPTLAHVTFSGNAAEYGGGIFNIYASDPTLTNVTFSGNHAVVGGGMFNSVSAPTLTNVTFSGNHAEYSGGGMANHDVSAPALTNVTFSGNHADYDGGGMRNSTSAPTLTNVTFSGNHADCGGGMYNSGGAPTLTNVTFSGNAAEYGGGMYNEFHSDPTLTNCILWGNSAGSSGDQIFNIGSTPTISYSDVQGGCPSHSTCDHLLDADPLFVRDPDPGDGDWTTPEDNDYGDLRLQPASPAVDAGNNGAVPADTLDLDGDGDTTEPVPYDLDGSPRFFDAPAVVDTGNGTPPIVDMGAYEAIVHAVYLPLVARDHVVAPNLVVRDLIAASDGITVVIENRGNAAAVDDFWVDAYVDPHTPPTAVNQTWDVVGSQGLAWGVTVDLAPGEALTLTVGGDYYVAAYSDVAWPLAPGTPVYAQVDSADPATTYGAVLEDHEITGGAYDNVAGPYHLKNLGDGARLPLGSCGWLGRPIDLPRRERE